MINQGACLVLIFYLIIFFNFNDADEATNVKWQTTTNCDFQEIGEEFSRKPYAIAVQKGSPLKEAISFK